MAAPRWLCESNSRDVVVYELKKKGIIYYLNTIYEHHTSAQQYISTPIEKDGQIHDIIFYIIIILWGCREKRRVHESRTLKEIITTVLFKYISLYSLLVNRILSCHSDCKGATKLNSSYPAGYVPSAAAAAQDNNNNNIYVYTS